LIRKEDFMQTKSAKQMILFCTFYRFVILSPAGGAGN